MNYFSDALTIGIVLVLLFGSIALYLYTRIQQTEQKNSLLESILLDLKMNAEMKSYSDLPAEEEVRSTDVHTVRVPTPVRSPTPTSSYTAIDVAPEDVQEPHEVQDLDQYSSIIDDAVNDVTASSSVTIEDIASEEIQVTKMDAMDSYEGMKLKELQDIAKSRGIAGSSTMKKAAVIDALRSSDRVTLKSGSASSLMDHSEVLSFE